MLEVLRVKLIKIFTKGILGNFSEQVLKKLVTDQQINDYQIICFKSYSNVRMLKY